MSDTTLNQIEAVESRFEAQEPPPLIPARGWVWIGLLGGLFCLLHFTYMERLFRIVTNAEGDTAWEVFHSAMTTTWNPDWSHVLVIPLISLYFLFLWRDRLAAAPVRVNWWGLAVLAFGLISYTWWIFPGRNSMLQGYSIIVSLLGLVLFLLGAKVMKVAWFPIVYLVFSVKVSERIWEQIAWTMQDIAARVSHVALQFLGLVLNFEAERAGNQISLVFMKNGQMVSESMNVAEACSGLRMLMAFMALGVALAFITPRPWWQRLLMIAVAAPVAILVNVGRVTTIGLLYLVDPSYARGDFHTFVGLLMLIPAALLILLIAWCADKIFIHHDKDHDAQRTQPPPPPIAPPHPSAELPPGRRLVAAGNGVLLGAVAALLLGGTYAGMWWLSAVHAADALPRLGLMALMVLTMVLIAGGVALVGRLGAAVLAPRRAARLPLAAGLCAGMLLTVWIGQASAVAYTRVVLIKKGVPLRASLSIVPQQLDNWKMVRDEGDYMTKEIIEVLGTTNFISRLYVNTNVLPTGKLDSLGTRQITPGSIARLHVAYYTGNPENVPHVPERCYLAGGAQGVDRSVVTLHLDPYKFPPIDPDRPKTGYLAAATHNPFVDVRLPTLDIPATSFTFRSENKTQPDTVIYFFMANGKVFPTPDTVRLAGFDPRDEYAYYAKIEVMLPGITDPDEIQRRTVSFLEQFLPEVVACLPDWQEVLEGRWPPDNDTAIAEPAPQGP